MGAGAMSHPADNTRRSSVGLLGCQQVAAEVEKGLDRGFTVETSSDVHGYPYLQILDVLKDIRVMNIPQGTRKDHGGKSRQNGFKC